MNIFFRIKFYPFFLEADKDSLPSAPWTPAPVDFLVTIRHCIQTPYQSLDKSDISIILSFAKLEIFQIPLPVGGGGGGEERGGGVSYDS